MDRHLKRQPPAIQMDKPADEILKSLADYLTKLGTGQPVTEQD